MRTQLRAAGDTLGPPATLPFPLANATECGQERRLIVDRHLLLRRLVLAGPLAAVFVQHIPTSLVAHCLWMLGKSLLL